MLREEFEKEIKNKIDIGEISHWSDSTNPTSDFTHKIIGVLLIISGFFIFVTFTIWIIISKFIDIKQININNTPSHYLDFIASDIHYCLAIPIIIPLTFVVFYFKWVALNYFKQC